MWPSSNSRRVAARPITPKRRSGDSHGSAAVLLSGNGTARLRKQPPFPPVSDNAWHVDASSSLARLPASTSASAIPKWHVWWRQRRSRLWCHAQQPPSPRTCLWLPPLPTLPLPLHTVTPAVTGDLQVSAPLSYPSDPNLQWLRNPGDHEDTFRALSAREWNDYVANGWGPIV